MAYTIITFVDILNIAIYFGLFFLNVCIGLRGAVDRGLRSYKIIADISARLQVFNISRVNSLVAKVRCDALKNS